MANDLDSLFETLKLTHDWSAIYEPLRNATKNIVANLKIPQSEVDDILHATLLNCLPKIKQIEHIGYILTAIKREGIKHGQNLRATHKLENDH